jgi:hypothetical protein
LIDYVASENGITVWAHPEARGDLHFDVKSHMPGFFSRLPFIPSDLAVRFRAEPHSQLLEATQGFTAFAALAEGYNQTAIPGGVWDKSLMEFAQGKRKAPYWAVGEMDYYGDAPKQPINEIETVFWVKEATREGILDAFRAGRMYVVQSENGSGLKLNRFFAESGGKIARSGEGVYFKDGARLTVGIESWPVNGKQVKVSLIQNGKIVATYTGKTPFSFVHTDSGPPVDDLSYFRIDVSAMHAIKLLSNPIFICRTGRNPRASKCN